MIVSKFSLDIRTKLFLVIIANLMVFLSRDNFQLLLKEFAFLSLFTGLLLARKRYRSAIIYSSLFIFLVGISLVGQSVSSGIIVQRVAAFSWAFVKLYPGLMAGAYLIHSSSPSMLFQAFDQLHLPRQLSIPFVVMLRFIPYFAEEFKTVVSMLRLRWSSMSLLQRLRPDYLILPLLNTAVQSAEDLSKAAYVRGLSVTGKRTFYQKNQPGILDALILVLALVITLV